MCFRYFDGDVVTVVAVVVPAVSAVAAVAAVVIVVAVVILAVVAVVVVSHSTKKETASARCVNFAMGQLFSKLKNR